MYNDFVDGYIGCFGYFEVEFGFDYVVFVVGFEDDWFVVVDFDDLFFGVFFV